MDGTAFVEQIREDNATALNRLGSEKAMIATTEAALDRKTVLESAAAAEYRAVETVEAWRDTADNDRAREAFADAAETAQDHYDRICDHGDIEVTDPPVDALHATLRGFEATDERVAGGLVARPLVASRTLLQVINFFVNEADTGSANLFRELRSATDEQVEMGAAVLDDTCEDWDRAAAAAEAAIDAAYDEYTETLDSLGIDPKPVC